MKYAIIAIALFVVVHAASDAGQFVPRAVYTLDSEGHPSQLHPISARLLRRLRRQVTFSSSSSTSSSSDGNGVVHQQVTNTRVNNDGSKVVEATIAHFEPTFDIAQRFGEDSPTSGFSAFSNTANTASAAPQGSVISFTQTTDAKGNTKKKVHEQVLDHKGQWQHREHSTTN